MANVFSNAQVAHVWAQQTQSAGRSNNGQFFFEGPTLYSYGSHFVVGRFVTNKRGERAVILNSDSYSPTTGRHQSYARSALHGLDVPVFYTPGANPDVQAGLKVAVEEAGKLAASAQRMRSEFRISWAKGRALELIDQAEAMAKFFGVRWKRPASLEGLVEEVRAAALRAAAETRKREAQARKRDAADFACWYANAPGAHYCPSSYQTDDKGGVYLRVSGDELQTSRGARVPLAHAIRAFRFIKLVRERGEGWKANGHSVHVGHFTVSEIRPNGDIVAGCHFIRWGEIERAAAQAKVIDQPADAAALEEA